MPIEGEVTGILVIERVPDPADPDKTIRQQVIKQPGETFEVKKGQFYQADGSYQWAFEEPYSGKGKKLSVFIQQRPQFGWNSMQVLTNRQVPNALISSFIVTIPATIIPIMIAAFAAYAFAWMTFPGRDWIFVIVVALLVVLLQLVFLPVLTGFTQAASLGTWLNEWMTDCEASNSCKVSSANSLRCGFRTRPLACHWRSTCCGTTSATCPGRCWRACASTVPRTCRRFSASFCR